jgi:hypothetical protein
MPPLVHIQSALIRRILLFLLLPVLFPLIFFVRVGKATMNVFNEIREIVRVVWQGEEENAVMLPCPFCGGKGLPSGWRSQGGASGPACDECGATTWSVDTWNTRIPLPDALTPPSGTALPGESSSAP